MGARDALEAHIVLRTRTCEPALSCLTNTINEPSSCHTCLPVLVNELLVQPFVIFVNEIGGRDDDLLLYR
jgi:hypothetical protein